MHMIVHTSLPFCNTPPLVSCNMGMWARVSVRDKVRVRVSTGLGMGLGFRLGQG